MEATRYALVTGGSRGIGRAISLALARAGWHVAVNYRGNEAAAKETLAAIEGAGGTGILIQGDIGDVTRHRELLEQLDAAFPRLDLLVNNAGMAPKERRDLLDMTPASYDEVMNTNLRGPFFLTQAIARRMAGPAPSQAAAPLIVNIGSISAYASSTNRGEYCMSKAGMTMMTTLFADRLAQHGINVYEVRPGIIETDMTAAVIERYRKLAAEGLTPMPRLGQPEDVAEAVVALAEGRFPFSTGEIINVDGGFHMHRL